MPILRSNDGPCILAQRPIVAGTETGIERSCRSHSAIGAKKMSRGMPSMTALLGLLALAGYQNRDKLGEMLKGATSSAAPSGAGAPSSPLGGLLGNLGGMLGG